MSAHLRTVAWLATAALGAVVGGVLGAADTELLEDPRFERGLILWAPAPGKHERCGVLQRAGGAGGEPAWGLAQWSSRFALQGSPGQPLAGGSLEARNEAKRVVLGAPGSPEADLILGINSGREYNDQLRRARDPWPHLLIEQKLKDAPSLAQMEKLAFNVEYRINKTWISRIQGWDDRFHTLHLQAFITVQNRNRQSPGFGDFLWFGVPLYDFRSPLPKGHAAMDTGSQKFIFTPHGEIFTKKSAHDGGWIAINKDLLPLMKEGLKLAWSKGYLGGSTNLADFRPGAINLGWEAPGPGQAEAQIRGLSLKASAKP